MPDGFKKLELVRGRAWPCPECGKGTSYFDHLVGSHGANGTIPDSDPDKAVEQISALESAWLRKWCESCPHRPNYSSMLPRLAEGSEHIVYFVEGNGELEDHVVKLTKLGIFGDYYFLENGRIHQRCATPGEYLMRLILIRHHFGFGAEAIGMTEEGQVMTKQKYVKGGIPTQEETDVFLLASGLVPVRQDCFVWKKTSPAFEFEIWVGDARDENFVKTENGIVPIDLRMWAVRVA